MTARLHWLTWTSAAALAFAPASAPAQDIGLALGTPAPDAVVQDLDGKAVHLGRYVGHRRPVLLEFWATWCPVCKALEPSIKAAHAKYGRKVAFVAVGVGVNESPRSIKRHLADDPLPFPVLFDASGAAVRAYQAPTTSYIVVLDREGKVAYTGAGAEQDIAAVLARLVGN
jgi:thiol-disulfide isomerase/thioredoxin